MNKFTVLALNGEEVKIASLWDNVRSHFDIEFFKRILSTMKMQKSAIQIPLSVSS